MEETQAQQIKRAFRRNIYTKFGKIIKKRMIECDMKTYELREKLKMTPNLMNAILKSKTFECYIWLKYKDIISNALGGFEPIATKEEIDNLFTDEEILAEVKRNVKLDTFYIPERILRANLDLLN